MVATSLEDKYRISLGAVTKASLHTRKSPEIALFQASSRLLATYMFVSKIAF